jgi:hypothetical protein
VKKSKSILVINYFCHHQNFQYPQMRYYLCRCLLQQPEVWKVKSSKVFNSRNSLLAVNGFKISGYVVSYF